MTIVKRILQGVGALVATFAIYLLTVALFPGITEPKQELAGRKPGRKAEPEPPTSRQNVCFDVEGSTVDAWLYLPSERGASAPCIVMAHGLGGTKQMGLDRYAQRFQAAGYAVLVFDYRYFGDSEGVPRHLIWIPYQLADWAAAADYARRRPEIDPNRIGLWGTSLSGGHVVVTAARDPGIACVAAQCPALDGHVAAEEAFHRQGIDLRLIVHAQRDLVRSWLGLPAHKIPIVGPPGSIALMATSEAMATFAEFAPADYINEACARIAIRADKYRPVKQAHRIRCPVLLQICDQDDLAPASVVEEAARRLGHWAEVVHYPIDHFDIYSGEHYEQAVTDQLNFFEKHLMGEGVKA